MRFSKLRHKFAEIKTHFVPYGFAIRFIHRIRRGDHLIFRWVFSHSYICIHIYIYISARSFRYAFGCGEHFSLLSNAKNYCCNIKPTKIQSNKKKRHFSFDSSWKGTHIMRSLLISWKIYPAVLMIQQNFQWFRTHSHTPCLCVEMKISQ